ncbi:MAG TPA: DUF6526 family protein [Acidobacteriaceae bacterium]|nr:DUF6526 family protein [Acidobacteriaceae bacterium]
MAAQVQSYSNHTRWHPIFHFVIGPIFMLNVIFAIVLLVRRPGWITAWALVVSIALLMLTFLVRINPLRAQDRIIRLEERVRLTALLPDPLRARISELTEDQLIGLRFASDKELPALVQRALTEKLNRKQIKQAVTEWRADLFRV